jgi:hypothetical protein
VTPDRAVEIFVLACLRHTLRPMVKQPWLTALRSGKYEQGQDALCQGGRYCCLGVGAEVLLPVAFVPSEYPDEGDLMLLPGHTTRMLDWRKVDWVQGADPAGVLQALAGLNDAGHTFDAIADLIEANL